MLKDVQKSIQEKVYLKTYIKDEISPGPKFDSVIVEDLTQYMINNYVKKNISLVFRASRDGYDMNNYYKKCQTIAPSLTIMKSSAGKVFGFYASEPIDDKSWNPIGTVWLFSLDEDKVYEYTSGNKIWRNKNCGIHVGDNGIVYCGDLKSGSAYVGSSFGDAGRKIDLAKSSQLEDVEVFQVDQ